MRRTEVSLAVICVVAAAVSTVFVLLASNRGIDVSDQSLYLTMVDQPTNSLRSASGYHHLLHPFFDLVGESVTRWRILRGVFDISSDLLFGAALAGWARHRHPGGVFDRTGPRIALIFGVAAVGFSSWAWTPNGFGYNELGTGFVSLLMAALLVMLSGPVRRANFWWPAVAFGALLGPMAIVKWSAATAVALVALVVLLAQHGVRDVAKIIGNAILGLAGVALLIHLLVVDLGDLVAGIMAGTSDVARGKHSLGRLSRSYISSLRFGLLNVHQFGLPVLVGLAVLGFKRVRSPEQTSPSLPTVAFAATASIALLTLTGNLHLGWNLLTLHHWAAGMVLLVGALVFAALWLSARADEFGQALPSNLLAAGLLAVPFGVAIGTNNPLLLGALISAPLWVGAAVVVGSATGTREQLGWVAFTGLMVLGAMVPVFAYNQLLHEPLQLSGDQNVMVEEGRFSGLRVDEDTHRFLFELEMVRTTLDDDPTVISLWRRPAVTFALGGHGLGFPWYSETAIESAAATMEGACEDQGDPTGQVVVVTEQSDPAELGELDAALRSCGIAFPEGFEHQSTLMSPDGTALDVYVTR